MKQIKAGWVWLVVGLLLAACSPTAGKLSSGSETAAVDSSGQTAETSSFFAGKKMAGILSGPVNDGGWNANAYLAMEAAQANHGIEFTYTEYTKVEDAAQVMRDYIDAGYEIIFAHGFEYADAVEGVAAEYPDIDFIQTNGSSVNDLDNLYTVTYSAGEGGYFMGWVACQTTRSGKIAFIMGEAFPLGSQQVVNMRIACDDLGVDAEVIDSYVGSWTDLAKTKELTAAAIEQGADVIVLLADAGDAGGIEAAREAFESGMEHIRVISWTKDKHELGPEFVIGGWNEDVTALLDYVLSEQIAKGKPGRHYALGLEEGAAYMNPFYGLVPPEMEEGVKNLAEEYLRDPSSIPNIEVRKDL